MARRRGQRKGWLRAGHGSWLLTYRLYDVLGHSERETVTIGPATGPGKLTRKQAERFAWDHYLSKVDTVASHPKATITVAQFWQGKYLPHLHLTKRPSTQGQYTYLWRKYLAPSIGSRPMMAVELEQAEALLADMTAAGLSGATVAHARKVGSAIFTRARKLRYFTADNPFQLVELAPAEPVKELFALTPKQALFVLDRLPGEYRPIVECGLLTGMNVAELLGLQLGDIRDGWIYVARQWYRGHQVGLKHQNRRRTIPVCRRLVRVLAVAGGALDDPVFVSRTGRPLNDQNIRRRFLVPIGKDLDLPGPLGWHILRHTFATWLEDCGVREFDRLVLMGHARRTMTQKYTHEDAERLRAAVEALAGRLDDARGVVVAMGRSA